MNTAPSTAAGVGRGALSAQWWTLWAVLELAVRASTPAQHLALPEVALQALLFAGVCAVVGAILGPILVRSHSQWLGAGLGTASGAGLCALDVSLWHNSAIPVDVFFFCFLGLIIGGSLVPIVEQPRAAAQVS